MSEHGTYRDYLKNMKKSLKNKVAKVRYNKAKINYRKAQKEDLKTLANSVMRRVKQLAIIFAVIFIAQGIWKGKENFFTTTWIIKSHVYQANPEEVSIDTCGLQEVICEGEKVVSKTDSEPMRIAKEKFPKHPREMYAIIMAESRGNATSMNWNCMYWSDKLGRMASESCRTVEDRKDAWSVDCGYMQINHIGKECPEELFNVDKNIEVAIKKYNSQGLDAWSSYKFKSKSFVQYYNQFNS